MRAYCKTCKDVKTFKKSSMGVRCNTCHNLEYDSFMAQEELSKKKFARYESRIKEMVTEEEGA